MQKYLATVATLPFVTSIFNETQWGQIAYFAISSCPSSVVLGG